MVEKGHTCLAKSIDFAQEVLRELLLVEDVHHLLCYGDLGVSIFCLATERQGLANHDRADRVWMMVEGISWRCHGVNWTVYCTSIKQ